MLSVGARDLGSGHAVAETEAVEILTALDLMDYAGPARTPTRTAGERDRGNPDRERKQEHHRRAGTQTVPVAGRL